MAIDSSYGKPGVRIIQEITTPNVANADPTLYPCIVGMGYQVVRNNNAGSYDGTSALYSYPNILGTATVDQSSVVVKAVKGDNTDTLGSSWYTVGSSGVTLDDDIWIERENTEAVGSTGEATASSAVFTDANATFISWQVKAGDTITIYGIGLNAGDHIVASVDSETQVTLTAVLPATQSNVDYSVTEIDYIGAGAGSIILISYRALRNDLADVQIYENHEDASSQLGLLVPENPLGFGVHCALLNSNAKIKSVGIEADTVSQHAIAAETLESDPDIYAIAPLTQDTNIHGIWQTHVNEMSAPAEKKERIVLTNRSLPLRAVRLTSTNATIVALGSNVYSVTRQGAEFITNGVINGDVLYQQSMTETSSSTGVTSYVVRNVTSEDEIRVYSTSDISGTAAVITVATSDYTKLQQAQHIRDYASSVEDRRVGIIWPDTVTVSPEGTETEVAGYYLAAAIAGATAALPAQQSFTRLKLAGFESLSHSNLGYFTSAQLDTIASGGVMIVVQRTPDSMVEIRHQLMSDMSNIVNREYSVGKNLDFIAKFIRERIDPLVGRWNITDFFEQMLKVTLQGSFENLKEADSIAGPNIISASIVALEQNATTPDRVDVIVDLVIPYPANDIRITLRV